MFTNKKEPYILLLVKTIQLQTGGMIMKKRMAAVMLAVMMTSAMAVGCGAQEGKDRKSVV